MKTLSAAMIGLALLATPVLAQTTTTATNPNGTPVTRIETTQQTLPREEHTDYGWIGLLGLAGLAGLLGRKKTVTPVVHNTAPINTTNRL